MRFKFNADKILVAGIALLLVVITIIVIVSRSEYRSVKNTAEWIGHTREKLIELEKITNLVFENESSIEDFSLNPAQEYTDRYIRTKKTIIGQVDSLKFLIGNYPIQRERIDSLVLYLHKHFQLTSVLESNTASSSTTTAFLISSNLEREFNLGKIKAELSAIKSAENLLLEEHKVANEKRIVNLYRIIGLVIGTVFVLILFLLAKAFVDSSKRKNAETKLIRANRLYLFISHINQMIVRATDYETMYNETCRIAVELGKFKMAWIGIVDKQTLKVIPVAHAGEDQEYLSKIKSISVTDEPEGNGPTGTALKEGRYIICNDIEMDPRMAPWKDEALNRGYFSSISLPIRKFGKIIGSFTLYAPIKNFFDDTEVKLLVEATSDISFALENFDKDALQKSSEAALLKSESQYQILAEMAPVGIFHTDDAGRTTYLNPRWCQIAGMSYENGLGNNWINGVHEEDKETLIKGWIEATQSQKLSILEFRFVHEDGNVKWVMAQAIPEKNQENKIIGYVGTITDITERRQAEIEIKKAKDRLEATLDAIPDLMFEVGMDGIIHSYHTHNADLLASPPEEFIGRSFTEILPSDIVSIIFSALAEAKEKGWSFGKQYPLSLNKVKNWFELSVSLMPDSYEDNRHFIVLVRNITERKNAEMEIENYRFALDQSSIVDVSDCNGIILYANENFCKISGYSLKELQNQNHRILNSGFHEKELFKNLWETVLSGKVWQSEVRNKSKNGSYYWTNTTIVPFLNGDGKPYQFITIRSDITESKKAQGGIIFERDLSDTIINNLPGIFFIYSNKNKFLRWNKNVEIISDYNKDEISKMDILDFIDAEDKEYIESEITKVFILGKHDILANVMGQNRKKIPFYFTGNAIEYNGEPALMAVGLDYSERINDQVKIKNTSEELRLLASHLQTVREDERKRIAREIHDELGQQLTAIKMDISWIDKKIPDETVAIKQKLKSVLGLVNSSNQSIRRLLNELRPHLLEDYGLLEALEWHGKQFTANTGIPVEFITEEVTDHKFSDQVSTCIFRVFQESLTNITRYAHATNVFILLKIIDGNITFTIEDNGKGFDPESIQHKKSFGILGIKERVVALNGKFEIESLEGEGTKIIINIPLDQ